jgi:predicted nucleic acid-binding Zn ribbon protein
MSCPKCGAATPNNWTLCADCIPNNENRPNNQAKIFNKTVILAIVMLFLLSAAAGYILCIKHFN